LVFLVVSFLLAFPPISYMHSSSPPFFLHALPISSSWLDHCNYVWRGVQLMKLLIMQFPPISRHFSNGCIPLEKISVLPSECAESRRPSSRRKCIASRLVLSRAPNKGSLGFPRAKPKRKRCMQKQNCSSKEAEVTTCWGDLFCLWRNVLWSLGSVREVQKLLTRRQMELIISVIYMHTN
jgi:hypothetical protein